MAGADQSETRKPRTLLLMRHAKSSWIDDGVADFDRPLAKRGRHAAPRMGAFIAKQVPALPHVLSSTALRARQTLELVVPEFPAPPTTDFIADLYLSDPDTLLHYLRRLPADVECAMIVGHNPELRELAMELTASADPNDIAALSRKFPTAAVASLTFPATSWRDLQIGSCRLVSFMTPRLLA